MTDIGLPTIGGFHEFGVLFRQRKHFAENIELDTHKNRHFHQQHYRFSTLTKR